MKKRSGGFLRNLLCTLLVFAVLLAGGLRLITRVDKASDEKEIELLSAAVRSAIVTCYSVEGAYPMDADYLKTHYGLVWDENRYSVVLDGFASNLMPSVSVFAVDGEAYLLPDEEQ